MLESRGTEFHCASSNTSPVEKVKLLSFLAHKLGHKIAVKWKM